ncbi:MAG: hypothetical protein Q7R70_00770 [Candidatus Diapherotrites archaeon]|nr:hypothetical protein [Candidatus Diapherotrites archaeon]
MPKPNLIARGLARRKYGLFGRLVKARPKPELPLSQGAIEKKLKAEIKGLEKLSKHSEFGKSLREKNSLLFAVKNKAKAVEKRLQAARTEVLKIIAQQKRLLKIKGHSQIGIKFRIRLTRISTVRLDQLRHEIQQLKDELAANKEQEKSLISSLREDFAERKKLSVFLRQV